MANQRYGLPYQGSKNKIAEWVVASLPPAEHFYDLFCGGCSVTHCGMLSGRWKYFHINDINGMMPQMFSDAALGKFTDEKRWISHEDFDRLKTTDAYVAVCFSFGNNLKNYAYGKELEYRKMAAHYAIVFGEYKFLKEVWGDDFSEIETSKNVYERYSIYKRLVRQKLERNDFQSLESLQRLQSLQSLESLQRLESLQSLQRFNTDYKNVKILPNSTVYCDIPYLATGGYRGGEFAHKEFYQWALTRDFPVFVSEYWMPDDFVCIAMKGKRVTFDSYKNKNDTLKAEKIFVQKRYAEKYKRELFL